MRGKSMDMTVVDTKDHLLIENPGDLPKNHHKEDTHAGHCHPEMPVKDKASHLPGHGSLHMIPEMRVETSKNIGDETMALVMALNIGEARGKEAA